MTDLVYATAHDVTTLEPTQVSGFADHTATLAIFGALVFNFDGRSGDVGYYPWLAESVEPEGSNCWVVRLRNGLRFHNGEAVDAKALKFSLERVLAPEFPSKRFMHTASISQIECRDRLTCAIHTARPIAVFPSRLLRADGYVVAPGHYGPDPTPTKFDPVGAGPFRYLSHTPGDNLTLAVFEDFADPRDSERPNFDRLVMRVVTDPDEVIAGLRAGEIDIAPIAPDQIGSCEAIEGVRVIAAPDTTRMSFEFNQAAHPALGDKRVRQAINHAIDVEALLERLTAGAGRRITTLVNPPNADTTLKPYAYDPTRARALLAEAGYSGGFPIDIDWSTSPDRGQIAEALRSYLEAVGITVRAVTERNWDSEYKSAQTEGTLGGLHGHGHAGVEMTAETDLWPIHPDRQDNSTNWSGPEADRFRALYAKLQQAVEPDTQQRIGHALQAIVHEEAVSVPLWQLPRRVAVGPRVAHFSPYPGGHNEDFWTIRMVGN